MDNQQPQGVEANPAEDEVNTPLMPGDEVAPAQDDDTEGDDLAEDMALDEEVPAQPSIQPFSWQASEFVHHQKSPVWYLVFLLVAAVFVGGAAFLQQWFTVAVFVVMTVALVVYAQKPPRVLLYELDDKGLTIDGKQFAYSQFRDFAVIEDVAWHSIELEPTQRFMPRLTILFDTSDFNHIVELLSTQLPRTTRTPDFVEKFTRLIKF